MKKTFNKVKLWLSAFWVAIISFFSKAIGQNGIQALYWVPVTGIDIDVPVLSQESSASELSTLINTIIKIAQRPLIAITFIIGIINFLKIRRIKDKTQKKKKIIRSVITIIILILLITASIIRTWINNPLKYNKLAWLLSGINIIKWIFIWVILLIGILYLTRIRKIKDKRERRKIVIRTIIIVALIVTYLVLAR